MGPTGPQGLQGVPGPLGPTGPTGATTPLRLQMNSGVTVTIRTVPVADTMFNGSTGFVQTADLSNYTQVRLHVNRMAGVIVGAKVLLRYSTAFGTIPSSFQSLSFGAATEVQADVAQPNAIASSAWFNIPAGAKQQVYLALITSAGDGRTDLQFGNIIAEFR